MDYKVVANLTQPLHIDTIYEGYNEKKSNVNNALPSILGLVALRSSQF